MYYYKQVKDGQIISVEAKSKASKSPHFIKATKIEYDNFIASLPVVEPEPVKNKAEGEGNIIAQPSRDCRS